MLVVRQLPRCFQGVDVNDLSIIQVIEKYNLSVRRIPDSVTEVNEIRHRKEGDEVITQYGRQFCRRTRIPEHAGWYMVKPINDTGSMVRWDAKKDNLAETLEGSIELFLGGRR